VEFLNPNYQPEILKESKIANYVKNSSEDFRVQLNELARKFGVHIVRWDEMYEVSNQYSGNRRINLEMIISELR
jgi:hypothetical protein